MSEDGPRREYRYEPAERRFKHKWHQPTAGFVGEGKGVRGKCPAGLLPELAQSLLNEGLCEYDGGEHPVHIYNVHEGVPYVAAVTRPGLSYHGYPARARDVRAMREAVLRLAEEQGCRRDVERWLKEHP